MARGAPSRHHRCKRAAAAHAGGPCTHHGLGTPTRPCQVSWRRSASCVAHKVRVRRLLLPTPQVFLEGLPGFPDGISRAPGGGSYWVAVISTPTSEPASLRCHPVGSQPGCIFVDCLLPVASGLCRRQSCTTLLYLQGWPSCSRSRASCDGWWPGCLSP